MARLRAGGPELDMQHRHVAIAVVGAGPAGSTCALSLRRHCATSVALIDRAHFPRDKSCGDGIGPGAVGVMNRLGLKDRLSAHMPITHVAITAPSGVRVAGLLPQVGGSTPVGYAIPRLVFDNYIFQAAIAAGAIDLSGHGLEQAQFADGKWTLSLKQTDTGEAETLTADVLIGADGARSRVRRLLEVAMNSDRHTGTAVRVYAEAESGRFEQLQLEFETSLLPAYGWLFPMDKRQANVGIGMDLDNYRRRGDHLKQLLALYRRSLGAGIAYRDETYNAFILPYGSQLPPLAHPAKLAALVGDAGSMINPLTGEGIFYGMFAGELLGRLLAEALARGDARPAIGAALTEFERQFRDRFLAHFQLTWRIKDRLRSPAFANMVVNACRKDHQILAELISLMLGEKKSVNIGLVLRVAARHFLLPAMVRGS